MTFQSFFFCIIFAIPASPFCPVILSPFVVILSPFVVILSPFVVILSPFVVILSPFAVILSPFAVILSEAKNLYRRPLEPVRRGVAGLTPLRIDDAIQSIY